MSLYTQQTLQWPERLKEREREKNDIEGCLLHQNKINQKIVSTPTRVWIIQIFVVANKFKWTKKLVEKNPWWWLWEKIIRPCNQKEWEKDIYPAIPITNTTKIKFGYKFFLLLAYSCCIFFCLFGLYPIW